MKAWYKCSVSLRYREEEWTNLFKTSFKTAVWCFKILVQNLYSNCQELIMFSLMVVYFIAKDNYIKERNIDSFVNFIMSLILV